MLGIDIVLLNLKLSRYQIYALRFLFLFPCFPPFYFLCTSTSVHILFPLCKKWCECLNIIEYAMCETSFNLGGSPFLLANASNGVNNESLSMIMILR